MSDLYESVGNYTKYKLVSMLIDKYKDLGDHNASCVEAWVDDARGCVY